MAHPAGRNMPAPSKTGGKRKGAPTADKPPGKKPKAAPGAGKQPQLVQATKEHKKLLSRKEHKELVATKKLKFKKNYATIQATVLLWEQLRPKTTSDEERRKLVSLIINKISGQVLELSNHHSASRVIQWCLKHAGPEDRAKLLGEVRGSAVALSKSKYGWHVVTKVINVASKEELPDLLKLFKGHVAELLRHPHGADVLVDLYDVAPQSARNAMCAELYGREYVLFDGVAHQGAGLSHLRDLLSTVPAAKQKAVVDSLYKALAPVLEKALLHPPMVHRLLRELLECAPCATVADTIDTLAATGALLKIIHTHDGAAAAAMALAYGTPKDRKRVVKAMKGLVWKMAENEWGYGVVCTALAVVDDTAITGKVICGEVKGELAQYVVHPHAHHVLLQLLAPDSTRYFPPAMMQLMHPAQRMVRAATAAAAAAAGHASDEELDEEEEEQQQQQQQPQPGADEEGAMVVMGASKKDPRQRRTELLGSGSSSLAAALAAEVAGRAVELLQDPAGSHVLTEVARGAADGLMWQADQAGVSRVHQAVVQAVQQPAPTSAPATAIRGGKQAGKKASKAAAAADGEGAPAEEHVLTGWYSSRALRQLVLSSTEEGAGGEGARAFVQQLWQQGLKGHCSTWYGSHADKVLAALVHCGVPEVCQQVVQELRPLVGGDVAAWSEKFVVVKRPTHGTQSKEGKQQQQQQQVKPTPAAAGQAAPTPGSTTRRTAKRHA